MSESPHQRSHLGDVLVIGGCGFFGFHLVQRLLREPGRGTIHVSSRNPTVNLLDGVTYHKADIQDEAAMASLLQNIKPRVIFNTASPPDSNMSISASEFRKTIIDGTQLLLRLAQQSPSVRAYISTSSVGIAGNTPHKRIDESTPYLGPRSGSVYHRAKASQERLVLSANGSSLATVSLRMCVLYGERDSQMVPGMLAAVRRGKTHIQLGSDTNLYDFLGAHNAAEGHLLAARALLEPELAEGKVAGEPFILTDDCPVPFWDVPRMIYRAAGDRTRAEDVKVIPAWLAIMMAYVTEFVFKVFTLGYRKPQGFNVLVVSHCIYEWTYNVEKAKCVLGYRPEPKLETVLPLAVEWQLKQEKLKHA